MTPGEEKPERIISHAKQSCDILPRKTSTAVNAVSGEKEFVMEKATFGAGCFWHVEEQFRQVPGVVSTQVGYMGGAKENPTYEDICSHTTGHAEVVEVTFDPSRISFDELLRIFWECHDPTQFNRQGPDEGSNYRSVVFYHTPEQAAKAKASLEREEQSGRHSRPIVTQIVPAAVFWRAEEYHQQYVAKRGESSCSL